MWRIGQLSQFTGKRPSKLLRLKREQGFSNGLCLDFDLAVVRFCNTVEALLREQVEVPESKAKKPRKGYTWGPRFSGPKDIFDQYWADERSEQHSDGQQIIRSVAPDQPILTTFAERLEDQL